MKEYEKEKEWSKMITDIYNDILDKKTNFVSWCISGSSNFNKKNTECNK